MADDRIQRPNLPYTTPQYNEQNEAAFRREMMTLYAEVDAALLRLGQTLSESVVAHASNHETGGSDPITSLAATVLDSGVLADARVQESNVTQHQAALTITESQISDLTHKTNLGSLDSVTDASNAAGWFLRTTGAGVWVAQLGLTEADITDLGTYLTQAAADALYSALGHTHLHTDITDFDAEVNTLADARIAAASIKDLSDVYSSMVPNDGEVLTYDTTNGWQAEAAAGGVTDHGALTGLADDDHSSIYAAINAAKTISGLWEFDGGIDFGVSSVVWGQIYASSGPGLAIEGLADVTFIVDSNNNSTLNEFMWGTNAAATGAPTQLMRLTDEGALWALLTFELGGAAPGSAVAKFGISSNDMYLDVDGSFVVNLDSDNDVSGATFQIATNGVGTGGGSDRFVVEDTGEAWALLELNAGGTHSSPEFSISEDSLSDWRVRTISGKMTLEALGSTTATGDGVYLDDGGTNNAKLASVKNITSTATAPTGDYPYGCLHLIY